MSKDDREAINKVSWGWKLKIGKNYSQFSILNFNFVLRTLLTQNKKDIIMAVSMADITKLLKWLELVWWTVKTLWQNQKAISTKQWKVSVKRTGCSCKTFWPWNFRRLRLAKSTATTLQWLLWGVWNWLRCKERRFRSIDSGYPGCCYR